MYSEAKYHAIDVAEFIQYRFNAAGPPLETLKLQKILYYAEGWSLALRNTRLFRDEIQAWKHGPVVASLYGRHRGKIVISSSLGGDPRVISRVDAAFIDCVVDSYGGLSGWALREKTHSEQPWMDAWANSRNGTVRGIIISPTAMQMYFQARPTPAALRAFDNRIDYI